MGLKTFGFLVLMVSPTIFTYASGLCGEHREDLACVKKNFDILYAKSYERLWQKLHKTRDAAKKCDSVKATAEFLGLADIGKGNAEFEEFFAETVEQVCVEHPQCFMAAALQIDSGTRVALKTKLEKPLFHDRTDIAIDRCLPATKPTASR